MTAVAAVCVGLAAVAVLWPRAGRRARKRRVLLPAPPASRPRASRPAGPLARRLGRLVPRTGAAVGWVPAVAAVLGTLLAGPVAGMVVGAYGMVAAKLVIRHRAGRAQAIRRAEWLDLLAAAAADLRAGLPASAALAGLAGGTGTGGTAGDPLWRRVEAAVALAERTGAPLADVLERIEADARGADRARAAAAAQTAGARATAWLLAGLPVGGVGLGYALGTDPLAVLLHTMVGAACAGGAVALQLAGLGWTGRIIHGATAVGS